MKKAIVLIIILCLISGVSLLWVSFTNFSEAFIFLVFGLLAIAAALLYTTSKKPYGYMGLGDLSVFVFFGLMGVGGSFYLHALEWNAATLLPAASIGFLCAAVLNVNNMRDIESDKIAGKRSIPVRLGLVKAKTYHSSLVYLAMLSMVLFSYLVAGLATYSWLYLLSFPIFIYHVYNIRNKKADEMDPFLKQLALSTLIFVLLSGLSFSHIL